MGEYTRLIANINNALNKIENGEETMAKVLKSDTTESTDFAGAAKTANEAESVKKAQSASFASVVPDMGITLVKSIEYSADDGWDGFDEPLPDGVYMVVAKAKEYSHTRNGVLVVEGTQQSYCRLSTSSDDEGATFTYYHIAGLPLCDFLDENGEEETPYFDTIVYFYRIGTLKKED